ncbi:ice-binding family protein [Streptomyces sp. NPDC002994]|uniref:ice-binding family protein n=1 Tax=Streptomyces sp. NPDC002994 TaxID=3154441 RepID=UPI0033A9862A
MKLQFPQAAPRRALSGWLASALAATVAVVMVAVTPTTAMAIATPVPLGTTESYSVLAGSGVTNTGPSVIDHDLGTHPTPAISGFPPGQVRGVVHAADVPARLAKSDLVVAYNNAAGQAQDFALGSAIGAGQELLPGVHTRESGGVLLNGDLVLNAGGNPNAVWVFQIPTTLTTASRSRVLLTNGASPCNVFWQIGSSATLGTYSTFVGTIMALTSISVTTGANIEGRALARNGAVTLDNNRIFLGGCATGGTTSGTTNGTTTGTTNGTSAGSTNGTTNGTTTGLISGGVLGGPILDGPILDGPIVSVVGGSTSGSISGNTAGNTEGNTSGNTAGNTAGNTTGGNTQGNSAGNTTGGPGHKPGKPDHHDKPDWPGHHDKPGRPGHHHDKPGGPGHHDDKPGHGHDGAPDKPGHGEEDDVYSYGYGDKPVSHKG